MLERKKERQLNNKLILFFILIFMAITYEQVLGALNEIDKETAQLIMPREGFSSTVYPDKDREGTVTGFAAGFGHKLTDEELKQYKVGDEIPHKQAVDWLRADLERTRKASQEQASQIPNVTKEFQESLQKVNYQLGTGWAQKFPTAWEHLKAGRWDQAIEEIKFTEEGSGQESKWIKQTPERAEDFTQAIQEQWEAAKVPSSPEYTEKMIDHWEIEEELKNLDGIMEEPDEVRSEKIKKVVESLGNSYFASFYKFLTKPESTEHEGQVLELLPEFVQSYLSAGKMLGKNIIEEQMSGEVIKPPITSKDFRPEELESLRHILLNKDNKLKFTESEEDNEFTRKMVKDGYKYLKINKQSEINVPPALKYILGGMWFKEHEDKRISIRDNYDFNPDEFPRISKFASSEEKKPGFSPGNRVQIELPTVSSAEPVI
jgi:GH24 family phage-related lysozyme (muramidase)